MQTNALANIPPGGFSGTLAGLFEKGVRYSTVIDVGCADGHFYLHHYALGLFPGSTVLNIDPNPIYEDSLKSIKDVMGGHYAIAAASDSEGEVDLTMSTHPYWSSLRPRDDRYWETVNHLHQGTAKVSAVTLDGLAARLGLSGPYLVKLDVQGAERAAIEGGSTTLAGTRWLLIETNFRSHYEGDLLFPELHAMLAERGFRLVGMSAPFMSSGVAVWADSLYERA